jgi:hypothetical protein
MGGTRIKLLRPSRLFKAEIEQLCAAVVKEALFLFCI